MSLVSTVIREVDVVFNFLRPEELKYILYIVIRFFYEYKNLFLFILFLIIFFIFLSIYFKNK